MRFPGTCAQKVYSWGTYLGNSLIKAQEKNGGGASVTEIRATARTSSLGALRKILIVSLALGAVLICYLLFTQ